MHMRKTIVCLIVTLFCFSRVFSQESKELQEKFLEAEYFLMNEYYQDALNIYLQLYESLPENANIARSIGICDLIIQGRKNLAVDYMEAAVKDMSAKHK